MVNQSKNTFSVKRKILFIIKNYWNYQVNIKNIHNSHTQELVEVENL